MPPGIYSLVIHKRLLQRVVTVWYIRDIMQRVAGFEGG